MWRRFGLSAAFGGAATRVGRAVRPTRRELRFAGRPDSCLRRNDEGGAQEWRKEYRNDGRERQNDVEALPPIHLSPLLGGRLRGGSAQRLASVAEWTAGAYRSNLARARKLPPPT